MDYVFISTRAYTIPEAGDHRNNAYKNAPSIQNLKGLFSVFPGVKTKDTHYRADPVKEKNPNLQPRL